MKSLALEVDAFLPGKAISTGPKPGQFKMAKQTSQLAQKGNMFLDQGLDGQVSGREANAHSSQLTRNSDCKRNPTPPFAIATPAHKLSSHGRRQVWLSSP